MQRELGVSGLAHYQPAFASYIIHNYDMLMNTLSALRMGTVHEYDVYTLHDLFVRHLGVLDELIECRQRHLRNPMTWLHAGIAVIVTLPFRLAYWAGLMAENSFERAANSRVVGYLTVAVTIFGLLSSVVTVVTGWMPFTAALHQWAHAHNL